MIEAPDGRNYLFAVASDGTRRWARPMSALPYDPLRLDISVAASAGHVYLAAANGCGTTSVHKYDTAGTWLATTDLRTSACPPESQPNTPRVVVGPSAVFVSGTLAGTMRVGNTSMAATADETAFIVKLTP